ncbi:MAG: 16S rRNA (guanine(966)-N(2))-methyltransferase RsmD [Rhodobacter sp.]|nr:16S rRNA (guanine(966)-N(2))-methyltransferase RsmD [Rhodobacter sp.]
MRIIAGAKRGLRLVSVGAGDTAAHLRPTSDRVRESLFNVLTSGRYNDPITGARVLDLFAGTGALGFEALSRGAAHVTFVDDGAKARALIRENTAAMQAGGQVKLFRRDATRLGQNQAAPFTLVFLDPPYGQNLGEQALTCAKSGNWLAPYALIVWEENAPQAAPEGFTPHDTRRYGDTHITILEHEP